MSKRIVIGPVFCEAHLIKYQIPNIIETLAPDYIIYNEGMFPRGPESTTRVDDKFIEKYTLDGHRGFDYHELEDIIQDAQKKYPDTKIILNKMSYEGLTDAPDCYIKACSNFSDFNIEIEEGDIIFPFEGDVFHHHDAKGEIDNYIEQLKPNEGFTSIWIDFVETQYYCEKGTLKPFLGDEGGRFRRVCVKFGTWEFYRDMLSNFMTQKYPMLYPTDLITYHYAWFRPGKYKQLRYDQLNRDKTYWANFDKGLQQIREAGSENVGDIVLRINRPEHTHARWAMYYEIEHPVHIRDHENFIKN